MRPHADRIRYGSYSDKREAEIKEIARPGKDGNL